MSELGAEVASASMKTVSQAAELLAKLIKFLLSRAGKNGGSFYDDQLKKQQAHKLKGENIERAVAIKYAGRSGELNTKKLQMMANNNNTHLYNAPVQGLSKEDFELLCVKMKNRGVSFSSAIERKSECRVLNMLDTDKHIFNEVLQEIITDRLVEGKNKEIDELRAKESLTPEEQERLDELNHEKDVLLCREVTDENKKSIDEVFQNVADEKKDQSRTFDDTVNHFTDRSFQTKSNEPYYVCDRLNPNSYIEMRESKDIFHDKQYRKTDFKVFKDGIEQKSDVCKGGNFNDARFEERPRNYWQSVRKEMKAKGGFSDDMVVFANKKDFEKYKDLYAKEVAKNTIDIGVKPNTPNYRNFSDIQNQLKTHLKDLNAEINEQGQLINLKTSESITKERVFDTLKTSDVAEKSRLSECLLIQKQMQNYKDMATAKMELTMAKAEYESVSKIGLGVSNEQIDSLTAIIAENEKVFINCEKVELDLTVKRNSLGYVDAINEVDTDRQIELDMVEPPEKENNIDHSELIQTLDEMDTMEQYEAKIAEVKSQSPKVEKTEMSKETHIDKGDR